MLRRQSTHTGTHLRPKYIMHVGTNPSDVVIWIKEIRRLGVSGFGVYAGGLGFRVSGLALGVLGLGFI